MSYIKGHDSPIFAVLSKTSCVSQDEGEITIGSPAPFLTEQIKKMLPEIKKVAAAFFRKDVNLKLEEISKASGDQGDLPVQTGANNPAVFARSAKGGAKKKSSDLGDEATQSPIVKEVISQFSGTITDVKIKK
jgi:hypothetical protein